MFRQVSWKLVHSGAWIDLLTLDLRLMLFTYEPLSTDAEQKARASKRVACSPHCELETRIYACVACSLDSGPKTCAYGCVGHFIDMELETRARMHVACSSDLVPMSQIEYE